MAATDQPVARAEHGQWSTTTNVWTATLPGGRTPYAALLVEARLPAAARFTIGLMELLKLDRRVAGKTQEK